MRKHHHGALLSSVEATILSIVISDGPIRQRELVTRTGYSAAAVSHAVKHMRAEGWVSGAGQHEVEVKPGAVVRAMQAALTPIRKRRQQGPARR